jgi:hypothetical protein
LSLIFGIDGSVNSYAEVWMLDIKRFTASSMSAVVFSRTFRLVLCRIDFWKFPQLIWKSNGGAFIGWTDSGNLFWARWSNDLSMERKGLWSKSTTRDRTFQYYNNLWKYRLLKSKVVWWCYKSLDEYYIYLCLMQLQT